MSTKSKAMEMVKEYQDDRPTVTMPGSDGTVAGTAVNEWLDDDGNPEVRRPVHGRL